MTKRTGYLIDPAARAVTAVEFHDLAGMQALIGGYLEVAYQWPSGDVLYVDEEGLLKTTQQNFFDLRERPDQVLVGNGLMVGREIERPDYPNGFTTLPPAMTLDDLRARVTFLRRSP